MDIVERIELPGLPAFKIKEVAELYWNDLTITDELYNAILAKDRKVLIKDLQKVMQHAVSAFPLFLEKDVNIQNTYFVWHALFMLKDLKAEEAFPDVLNFFRQDESLYTYYMNEGIDEVLWEIFYVLGLHRLKELVDFYESLVDDLWIRPEVLKTLQQVALRHPEKRLEVEAHLRRLLNHVQTRSTKDDLNIDEAALSLLDTIGESGFTRLLPEVKKALAAGTLPIYLDIKADDYEQKYFASGAERVELLEFQPRKDVYDWFADYEGDSGTYEEDEDDPNNDFGFDPDYEDSEDAEDDATSGAKENKPKAQTFTIPPYERLDPNPGKKDS